MKIIASALLLALSATTLQAAQRSPPLPSSKCIDTKQINDWHVVDARRAIVRTGPKYFLVTLQAACPQLRHPPGLIFRASPANASTNQGRICGDVGETVRSHNQPPCGIESVSPIDKAVYQRLSVEAQREGEPARDSMQAAPEH